MQSVEIISRFGERKEGRGQSSSHKGMEDLMGVTPDIKRARTPSLGAAKLSYESA